jgi:class 3 adenylate cyclase/pimeloyl-ACP methyl ester carboxylesterase
MAYRKKTYYTMSGDVSIAYQIWGEGPIDIIMVPILVNHIEHLLDLDEYVQFMEGLSSFSRVITFDKRGQGMSDYPGTENSLETRVDDVRAIMDATDCKNAVIFGASEGGPISIMFSATYPERVNSLVLYGAFAKFLKTDDYPYPTYDMSSLMNLLPWIMSKWGTGVMSGILAPSFEDNPEKLEWLAKLERLSNTPGGIKTVFEMNTQIDVHSLLELVKVPTLILHKKNDTAFSVSCGRHLHEKIPQSKFVELKGNNHFPYLDDIEEMLNEIEKFISGQSDNFAPSVKDKKRVPLKANRVLATVLFTDIVDSTALASGLGDKKWKDVLNQHDRISKTQIKLHRGNFIKSTGDGLLATFDGPGRAIHCAKSISKQLEGLGIKIRSGLHTGEIEMRGKDIGGISVNIAARIESVASSGEILVSRTVTDLVAGSGITFESIGSHELKGIPGSVELFSVE